MNWLTLFYIPLFLHIGYTDFTVYKVNVFTLFSLFGMALITVIGGMGISFQLVLINIILLSICIICILLYAVVKGRGLLSVFAMGDILILIFAALIFSPFNYLVFIVLSTSLSLLVWLLVLKRRNTNKIPYAGFCAVLMILLVLIDQITPFNIASDLLMINSLPAL